MIRLLRLFDLPSPSSSSTSSATWELGVSLCYYSKLYGAQIVLVALLSAMTVYRREMSCNHVYNEDDDDETSSSHESPPKRNEEDTTEHATSRNASSPSSWNEEKAEELLEGVGRYCSGEPLLAVALSLLEYLFFQPSQEELGAVRSPLTVARADDTTRRGRAEDPENDSLSLSTSSPTTRATSSPSRHLFTHHLPSDLQIYVLSHLHPKDVVTLACVSQSCKALVNDGDTSEILWCTLWRRDYAWLVQEWEIGRQALARSNTPVPSNMNKTFYFVFGQAYMNYVLAGCNTSQQCLVGLHGNIYNLTPFLHYHPGSPDTLMVHAGREATSDFERMNHSRGARRLAGPICVVVDSTTTTGSDGRCGVHPTIHTTGVQKETAVADVPSMPMGRAQRRAPQTLHKIKAQYEALDTYHTTQFRSRFAKDDTVLGGPAHVNVYYDPFCGKWKSWYTNTDFETVFVDA